MRRKTIPVHLGGVQVGGGAPITVQSMTNTDTADVEKTVEQIDALTRAGCEIVRVAVPDAAAAGALTRIKERITIPLIADIHFDYRLALAALEAGVDGLRLNPGNIGSSDRVAAVSRAAGQRGVPIRVGVNAGSLERHLLGPGGEVTAQAMVDSALEHIRLLEATGFRAIKVSLKSSDVPLMLEAYRLLAARVDYPFHAGVTEAGGVLSGSVRSAVGLGLLLAEGLGDTVRVSLTGSPLPEIKVAYGILGALGLRKRGPEIISCPTCGRCRIDLVQVLEAVEERLQAVDKPLKVAVMGCVVNGPGEARQADVGIAGGRGSGLLFRGGQVLRTVPEEELVEALLGEIEGMLAE
ncbi:MAG TPA: flavodoxin-dependent (E)-4-hydroxy-3-methylbut-2-enyl-diphosphate synthase [Spirochaetia bacterium]|nr:flavodoxin-dependent (E)-4-hydroxy-3-methylbut-2-enyl-diphosphate synthase [Spirochaetia bacterium]